MHHRIIDESEGDKKTYTQYFRLKVFDDRGVEALQQIDMTAGENERIVREAARVIRPDGTIETIPDDAFFDREVWRQGRDKVRAKSFSVPHLAHGSIRRIPVRTHPPG